MLVPVIQATDESGKGQRSWSLVRLNALNQCSHSIVTQLGSFMRVGKFGGITDNREENPVRRRRFFSAKIGISTRFLWKDSVWKMPVTSYMLGLVKIAAPRGQGRTEGYCSPRRPCDHNRSTTATRLATPNATTMSNSCRDRASGSVVAAWSSGLPGTK